jgi:hypothetical protein
MTKVITKTLEDLKVREMGITEDTGKKVVAVHFPIITDEGEVYERKTAYFKEDPLPISGPDEFRLPAIIIPVLDDLFTKARIKLGQNYLDE